MDTSKLKIFAPDSRNRLIEQIGVKLDYVLTARTPDLVEAESLVRTLRSAVERKGRDAVIEEVAYTWFNRFAALRYLDAREWHPFRFRVITSVNEEAVLPDLFQQVRGGSIPDELTHYLSASRVADLLDGRLPSDNPQGEVQRLIIIAVCNYYAVILPHLFTRLDDFSQLLLPDDVLTSQSIPHGFRTEISDDDCSEVEILGWLYQFYISEKKDAVMARKKAVPSEDIPAVTQLFTPHWIVRYLVENSLGRLWLRSKPDSRLRDHMPYYVEDPEGQEPADSLTVATPEEIKLLDPACGSGHMLTYAFDLLVKIYEEEGHAPSEIPEKILTHNLFGLEICPRAAQLAQFALVCKAREQSRAAFRRPVQPQVMCLRDVAITADEMQAWCEATGVKLSQDELSQVHQFRENTQTFGSLIQPVLDVEGMAALREKIGADTSNGDLLVQNTHRKLRLVLEQSEMLSQRYQVVVANPPYMGGKHMTPTLKTWASSHYANSKVDAFAMFIDRCLNLSIVDGLVGMITMQSWMFLSTFEPLRELLLARSTISSMAHLGPRAFDTIGGEVVQTTAFVLRAENYSDLAGSYLRLIAGKSEKEKASEFQVIVRQEPERIFRVPSARFSSLPGKLFIYWAAEHALELFESCDGLGDHAKVGKGLDTGDNDRFLRSWQEIGQPNSKWMPCMKGGEFRKWYGNLDTVINWENNGAELKSFEKSNLRNASYYLREGVTWTRVATSATAFRIFGEGCIFESTGPCVFPNELSLGIVLGYLNSSIASYFLGLIAPTMDFQSGHVSALPLVENFKSLTSVEDDVAKIVFLARADWDNFETSWDFRDLPLLRSGDWEVEPGQPGGPWKGCTLAESWANYAAYCTAAIRRMQELETENNRLWIEAYGLQDELTPEVPEDEITLARADEKTDMIAFVSYAVGCMMGRYSLDQPGLILADAGDTLERYFEKVGKSADEVTFLPDDDAIIPITEDDWFEDDAASRVREFLKATFDPATVDENVAFIEEALGKKLRKYFTAGAGGFYADHLKTYKKRPIYWMFESPKKHFRALVYLHRYNRDTVNTLLSGYLREFINKLTSAIDQLEHATSISGPESKRLDKLRVMLRDAEDYERDLILPLAQERIDLDLDDGVKANYPKFGKALTRIPGVS